MSKQADIEFLFILALENYTKTNNLTYEESAGIFHKNNIMEKMLVQHDFDVVIGPVADDNTMQTVQLYLLGTINAAEAVERLKYNDVNNQVSFHTEKAIEKLVLLNRSVIKITSV